MIWISAFGINPARSALDLRCERGALRHHDHDRRHRDRLEFLVGEGFYAWEPEWVVRLPAQRHAHDAGVLE
jgi:hypothetical protein